MKDLEKKIFEYLWRNLNPERFEHSYCVSKLASKLAAIQGVNVFNAQTAGLLHDCAKSMNGAELVKTVKKNGETVKYFNEISRYSPGLLHSFAGAVTAQKEFKIRDKDMLNAVRYHTLGRPAMSVLEKILFVSDAASSDRKYKEAAKIRVLAETNLEKAFLKVLSNKIIRVINDNKWLCPQTADTWNYYAQKD